MIGVRTRGKRVLNRWADRWVRRGSRTVLWTQPTAHLGNFLYEWMHAFACQQQGMDIVCLHTPAMDRWLPVFGDRARLLVVEPSQVRWIDRRNVGLHNEWGVTFERHELDLFIASFVEPSGVIDPARVPARDRLGESDVLVNVRRGDYFTNEANRRSYSFDLNEYLTAALDASIVTGGPIDRIHVVSDGAEWCREHLDWMAARCQRLTFEDRGQPPEVHLAILANAPRLVLVNSTFSYWGGYLSQWRHQRPESIVAPWFIIRGETEEGAWQLDPGWTVIRDIPSGWKLPT